MNLIIIHILALLFCALQSFQASAADATCRSQYGGSGVILTTCTSSGGGRTFDLLATHSSGAELAELQALHIRGSAAPEQVLRLTGELRVRDLPHALELQDINFDGAADLALWTDISAGPNQWREYWLYRRATGKFEPTSLGDELSGFDLHILPKQRKLVVEARDGCCQWQRRVYQWRGGRLTHISTTSYLPD